MHPPISINSSDDNCMPTQSRMNDEFTRVIFRRHRRVVNERAGHSRYFVTLRILF